MKVLIIRFSALGDITLSLPIIQKLNQKYPELELFVLSKPFAKKLFSSVDIEFIDSDLNSEHKGFFGLFKLFKKIKREQNPDIVIDLHQVLRSKLLSFFFRISGSQVFSINKGRKDKKALVRKENKIRKPLMHSSERYAEVFENAGFPISFKSDEFQGLENTSRDESNAEEFPKNKVGIAPLAQHSGKSWPLGRMKTLITTLVGQGMDIYLFGGPMDKEILDDLSQYSPSIKNMAGIGDLNSELEMMKDLDVFVAMDSSNMHLATMANIPVVSIWGATHSFTGFGPLGNNDSLKVEISPEQLNCRPCSVFGNKECFRGDYACLNRIDSKMVMEKINLALDKNSHDA